MTHAYTYDALGGKTSDTVTVVSRNPEKVDIPIVKSTYS
jgi:hypothetical protein